MSLIKITCFSDHSTIFHPLSCYCQDPPAVGQPWIWEKETKDSYSRVKQGLLGKYGSRSSPPVIYDQNQGGNPEGPAGTGVIAYRVEQRAENGGPCFRMDLGCITRSPLTVEQLTGMVLAPLHA